MKSVGISFILALMLLSLPNLPLRGSDECADINLRLMLTFPKPYKAYQAICTSVKGGTVNMEITKDKNVVGKFILKTITQTMSIRPIKLESKNKPDIMAIFVECSGGSAANDYIFEIKPNPPCSRQLLYNHDRDGIDYGYDSKGRLTGMRFHYCL